MKFRAFLISPKHLDADKAGVREITDGSGIDGIAAPYHVENLGLRNLLQPALRRDRERTKSAAQAWPILAAWLDAETTLARWAAQGGLVRRVCYEFVRFGLKQAWACLFGGLLLGLILVSRLWYPPECAFPRYDALVLAALAIQLCLLLLRLETVQEAKVILAFHVVGTAMEIFKTGAGSWTYPEASFLHIGGVPLFSGFMYAAVGSYLFRVWRLFHFRFDRHPPLSRLMALSLAIYGNFFADHWGIDLRWPLIACAAFLFWPTVIHFQVWKQERRMPLLLGFLLVALFIWFGENLGTAGRAWVYPAQAHGWTMVAPGKLTSWFLLMLVSYTMVAATMLRGRGPEGAAATLVEPSRP